MHHQLKFHFYFLPWLQFYITVGKETPPTLFFDDYQKRFTSSATEPKFLTRSEDMKTLHCFSLCFFFFTLLGVSARTQLSTSTTNDANISVFHLNALKTLLCFSLLKTVYSDPSIAFLFSYSLASNLFRDLQ